MGTNNRITWMAPYGGGGMISTLPAVDLPDTIAEPHIGAALGQFRAALEADTEARRRLDVARKAKLDAGYQWTAAVQRGIIAGTPADVDRSTVTAAEEAADEAEQVVQLTGQTMPNVYGDLRSALIRYADDLAGSTTADADERVLKLASALYTIEQQVDGLAEDLALLEMLAKAREQDPMFPWRPQLVENGPGAEALADMQEGVATLRRSVAGVRARLAAL